MKVKLSHSDTTLIWPLESRKAAVSHGRAIRVHVGDLVEVRSEAEILATLDENGELEALPFMPEMLRSCGKRFTVFKRADKTCDTIERSGLRRLKNTVHLADLRCEGIAHGGCQAGCLLFWKEAWLKPVSPNSPEALASAAAPGPELVQLDCTVQHLFRATRRDRKNTDDPTYSCQATQLRHFTTPMKKWDLTQYVRDIRSRNVGLWSVIRGLAIEIFNTIQRKRGGRRYPQVEGTLTKTPSAVLNLQAGELVEIKSQAEILATVDTNGNNRGLSFDTEMVKFCGRRSRVLRRVDKIINERTGKMMAMKHDCIILDGVVCESDYHRFCPRSIYSYWREIWLKRVE